MCHFQRLEILIKIVAVFLLKIHKLILKMYMNNKGDYNSQNKSETEQIGEVLNYQIL